MLACLGVFALLGGVAQADFIDFESDPIGPKPQGWASADSAICHFSSQTANLRLDNWTPQSDGKGLASFGSAGMLMEFDVDVIDISLEFGNDDPGIAGPGSLVWLTLFLDAAQVAQTTVVMNLDDIMNQTISIFDICFDEAVVLYTDPNGTPSTLAELVDNISFTECDGDQDVPEPATLLLIGAGIAGLGIRRRLLG